MGDILKKRSAAVDLAVEAGLALFGRHKRGDIVPWREIERAAGFLRDTQHWTAFMRRVRRDFLRQARVCLWAIPGDGLKLLTVAEQLSWRARKRWRRAFRQLRRDQAELAVLTGDDLTPRQAEERARRLELNRGALKNIRRAQRQGSVLDQKQSYQPRPLRP